MRSRGYLGKCGPRQSKGQELGAQSCECEDVVGHPQGEGVAVRLPSARPEGRGGAVRPAGLSGPLPTVLVSLPARYFFNKEGDFNHLTAAAYHKKVHLLVTGFASGIFHLHELPEFNLIHSLRSAVLLCVVTCVVTCVRVCVRACVRARSQSTSGQCGKVEAVLCPSGPRAMEWLPAARMASQDTCAFLSPGLERLGALLPCPHLRRAVPSVPSTPQSEGALVPRVDHIVFISCSHFSSPASLER